MRSIALPCGGSRISASLLEGGNGTRTRSACGRRRGSNGNGKRSGRRCSRDLTLVTLGRLPLQVVEFFPSSMDLTTNSSRGAFEAAWHDRE